eukprot:IDg11098t1
MRSNMTILSFFMVLLLSLSNAQMCTSSTSAFQISIGEWSVHILNDGNLRFPSNPFLVPLQILIRAFKFYHPRADPFIFPQNVALLRQKNLNVLIDAGSGGAPSPFGVAGNLPKLLRSVGTSPEAITHVILTHAHFDHLGGLLTTSGKAVFPNAAVMMTREEHAFWSQPLANVRSAAPHVPAELM